MLIEMAIGDAYGIGFEFATKVFVKKHNTLEKYYPHQKYTSLWKKYSDDTQMVLAIAELVIETKDWNKTVIAQKLVDTFKRDERAGYSSRMYDVLNNAKTGEDFLRAIDANSESNGAATRAVSIGFYQNKEELIEKATLQAQITHNTINGIKSAQAVALMVHFFIYEQGKKQDLGKYLNAMLKESYWDSDWIYPVSQHGIESVLAVITALKRNNSMKNLLWDCVNFTGDVDTVAAIALGVSALCEEFTKDLPLWLYEEVENATYGSDYLKLMDKKLMDKIQNI